MVLGVTTNVMEKDEMPESNLVFLIDVSGSMSGEPIDELNKGLNRFKEQVCKDEQTKKNAETALRLLNSEKEHEIIYEFADTSLLPDDLDKRSPDNMILSVALKYRNENPVMLTSDNGLQLKSKIFKITTISLKSFLKRY